MKYQKLKKNITLIIPFLAGVILFGRIPSAPEEGMYPVTEINKVDLKNAGLKIEISDIYNPDGLSLVDALVRLPGCTGSFVSENGLIITNHHCSFGSVSRVSTTENNYLGNGFLAKTLKDEIPIPGYFIRIAESYEDASDIILKDIERIEDLTERAKVIADRSRKLTDKYSEEKNAVDAEVSEMFIGKTYMLIKYKIFRDVRLVYVPPIQIGNFGGETDNWIWPRHTGDFSFLRAYTAPDGTSAEFSENNAPYKPAKYLTVNPGGVEEGDFIFILGYPARTFRHRPSQFLKFQEEVQLPYIEQLYSWGINLMEELGKGNPELELKYANPIKSLANTMKNYRGKLKGLKKLDLVEKKCDEEKILQSFINSKAALKNKYGNLLQDIDTAYKDIFHYGMVNLWYEQMERRCKIYSISEFLLSFAEEMNKPEAERNERFKEENVSRSIDRINGYLTDFDLPFEKQLLAKMLLDASKFGNIKHIKTVDNIIKGKNPESAIKEFAETVVKSKIFDKEYFNSLLEKSPDEIAALNDPLLKFTKELLNLYNEIEAENLKTEGKMNKLLAQLVEVKSIWKKTSFIPDANYSLRLTYGYVRGYSPADAVYYNPITTLDGVIEKSYLGGDYAIPDKINELYEKKDFGKFYNKKLDGIPVAILYNMDTSGGNSGSPILNAYGELVGLNFDRAFEATINDYAWDESYSRSIGVDIRYILWIAQKFSGATNILNEMGVIL